MHAHRSFSAGRWPCALLATVAAGLAVAPLANAEEVSRAWPGFRGENANGHWHGSTLLSTGQDIGLKQVWSVPTGSGYSGVAVANGVVVTAFSDGTNDVLTAFDQATGAEKWRYALDSTYLGTDGAHTGPIATPLIYKGHVYMLAPRGKLVAVDLEKGKEVWAVNIIEEYAVPKPHYGCSTSPIGCEDTIILQLGAVKQGEGPRPTPVENQAVIGVDPLTGKKKWTVGTDTVNYQSPMVTHVFDGKPLVLVPGDANVMAIDPKTGEMAWQFAHGGGGPTGAGSMVPTMCEDKDTMFLSHKQDAAGVFKREGDEWKPVWEDNIIRNSYNVPVYHDGHVYAYSTRILVCVDTKTGDPAWRSRLPGDGFLIAADGHLVIITKKGTLHIAKATPAGYEERAALPLLEGEDLSWAHPAFVGNSIFIRSLEKLIRVDITTTDVRDVQIAQAGAVKGDDFAAFIQRVKQAEEKNAAINAYLEEQKQFPIIEGKDKVHFVYYGEAKDIAIAGDLWGARQERPMIRVPDTNLYYYSATVEPDARLNYVFIKDYTEIPDPRNERACKSYVVGKDMEMTMGRGAPLDMSWFAMPAWEAPRYLDDKAEFPKGKLETKQIKSKVAAGTEFEVKVYTPAGYEKDDGKRYPVAYVHGGSTAQMLGNIEDVLDGVVAAPNVQPSIIVLIGMQANVFQPESPYPKIVAEDIVPFIDANYRTIAQREARASIGHGFDGFAALVCAFRAPEVIGRVGCRSMYMFGSMESGIKQAIPDAKKTPMAFCFEWGKYDFRNPHENWDMGQSNAQFAELLKSKGFDVQTRECHDGTDWSCWKNRYHALLAGIMPQPEQRS